MTDVKIEPEGPGVVRLYRIPEAMARLSLSRSVLYEQIRAGRLKSVTSNAAHPGLCDRRVRRAVAAGSR